MVLTPMLFLFKKVFARIFRRRSKMWYSLFNPLEGTGALPEPFGGLFAI